MKDLFLLAMSRLKTVDAIEWSDLDKGQINNYEVMPPIDFPAALIKIDYPQCENMGGKKQKCRVRLMIRLAFDYTGETDSTMPETALNSSLLYFETVEEVYKAFQGFINPTIAAQFNRIAQVEENRPDGLKVVNMTFETYVHDMSAAT